MDRETLYERALNMIQGCKIEVGGMPQSDNYVSNWLREMAREALSGIDPTTGKTPV